MAVCDGKAESVRGLATTCMSTIQPVPKGMGVCVCLCVGKGVGRCSRRWEGCKGGECMVS
jgi:hypothetical protein